MRLETVPQIATSEGLNVSDFVVFSSRFTNIVRHLIPTSKDVRFASLNSFCKSHLTISEEEKAILFNRVVSTSVPEKAEDNTFILPLKLEGEFSIVLMVSGLDNTVVKKTSIGWLQDIADSVVKEFIKLKRTLIDPATGLYNMLILTELLEQAQENKQNLHVVLVEILPPSRLPKDVFDYVRAAARSLAEFDRYGFPLFHLGQSVFALVIPERRRDFLKNYCLSLITYLKNKGFRRVHCGCSSIDITRENNTMPEETGAPLDEAWTALHIACRRGPFAFCDYDILANPDHFPLKAASRSTIAKLQRRWRGCSGFSLLYFKPDFKDRDCLADIMARYFGNDNYIAAEEGIFVIRKDIGAKDSKKWAESVIKLVIEENNKGFSMSVGISEFPFRDYSRTEIIRNCQKALLHGDFFGFGSCVIFDETSLNISGDVYYGEGDLTGAVKEYRRGLELDGNNINLLNSLGVAFAFMNRNHAALRSFQAVLDVDPENLMALYNKGLGEQMAGRYRDACDYYGRALEINKSENSEQKELYEDLVYRLGACCYYNKEYQRATELLKGWYRDNKNGNQRGKCSRFIGISFFILSNQTEAKKWLQRAVVFDEYDAESMNLLGELYFNSNEGDDIAFKLLEKSIEINSSNMEYVYRYGKCLNLSGKFDAALLMIRRCVRTPAIRYNAWYELLIAYKGLKKYNKARYYLRKLEKSKGVPHDLCAKARNMRYEITQG